MLGACIEGLLLIELCIRKVLWLWLLSELVELDAINARQDAGKDQADFVRLGLRSTIISYLF